MGACVIGIDYRAVCSRQFPCHLPHPLPGREADSPAPKSFKRITRVTIMGDYGSEEVYNDPYEEIQVLRNALGKYEDLGYTPEQLKKMLTGDNEHG